MPSNKIQRLKSLVPASERAAKQPTKVKQARPKVALWKGPYVDGITFSLLCKFLVCRERFRLKVIEGLQEERQFDHKIEFGSMWHEMEEVFAHTGSIPKAEARLQQYVKKLLLKYQNQEAEIYKWAKLCKGQFPLYVKWWAEHPNQKSRTPVLEEVPFKIPYKLPSGRTIYLRGKYDAAFLAEFDPSEFDPKYLHLGGDSGSYNRQRSKSSRKAKLPIGLMLGENKSKGKIDEQGLLKTVGFNLQTMIYQTSLRHCYSQKTGRLTIPQVDGKLRIIQVPAGVPIIGTIYNVVRRPLADQYAPKQRKGRQDKKTGKRVGAESMQQFIDRVIKEIEPENQFKRWEVILDDTDMAEFAKRSLNPILEQVCNWWHSIQYNPFDPWNLYEPDPFDPFDEGPPVKLGPNIHHWQAPWGVYNSMFDGMRGDFFELLTEGNEAGLLYTNNLFPEL